jgi:hypothetical protein
MDKIINTLILARGVSYERSKRSEKKRKTDNGNC